MTTATAGPRTGSAGPVDGFHVRPAALTEATHGASTGQRLAAEGVDNLRRVAATGGGAEPRVASAFAHACTAWAVELAELASDATRLGADVQLAAAEYLRTEAAVLARAGGP